jgi:Sap, sulfolipid-1-addressing protein
VLATPRGRTNGILFGAGWLAGLTVLGAVVLALAGPADASEGGQPAPWTGWLKLVLGLVLLSAVNPKNGGLTIAAAATIAAAGLSGGEQAVVLAVFVLIGSIGVLAPLVVYLVAGQGAARTLDNWKTWATIHNAAVMAVLFLVFGLKLVGDGIAVLL